tara:strand:- start:352 stop:606 length:255 start_codon:yes stop_codon:yes gene_type:complete
MSKRNETVEEFLARGGRIERSDKPLGAPYASSGYANILRVLEQYNKPYKAESEWAKSKRLDKEMEDKYEKIHQERDRRYCEKNV